jgi:glutamyl-Q tRNA(Asp) synthetase
VPGAAAEILDTLGRFGMFSAEQPVWQSQRGVAYQQALEQLLATGFVFPCGCTRREIADSLAHGHTRHTGHTRHATLTYPGTCRDGLHGKPPRAWRMRVPDGAAAVLSFKDRWQGTQTQDLASEVGDFVLKRADGEWAYQLAVVVDDADAGITHIVRGADLLDSTARQIYLQRCLGVSTPAYLHVPVIVNELGEKLSKQTGATALDTGAPLVELTQAAKHLGLHPSPAGSLEAFFSDVTAQWAKRFAI